MHGCLSFEGMGKYCGEVVELAGLNVFTLGGGSGSLFLVNVRQSVSQSKQKQAKNWSEHKAKSKNSL